MTLTKTGGDRWVLTSQRSAPMLVIQISMEVASIRSTAEVNAVATIHQGWIMRASSSVPMVTLVTELITESKNSITQINTKPNFAPRILNRTRIKNVIIKNFVPLPTILKSYP